MVNDDLATAKPPIEYMRAVVLIATDRRVEITTENIQSLRRQTKVPHIRVVVSNQMEYEYYSGIADSVVLHKNQPLGAKWQRGVTDADCLIIVGSDDILAPDYVEHCCRKINEGYDMVGTTSWYMTDWIKTWECRYVKNENFPLGSGKAMSRRFLNSCRWQIFDIWKNKGLDNLSYDKAVQANARIHLIREPRILSVKGSWQQINSLQHILKSRSVECLPVSNGITKEFLCAE